MNRLFALLVSALVLFGAVMAQQTPAGTNISNQASASYIDSAGQSRSTTSNEVVTVVQQVYAFTITPNANSATEASVTTFGQTRSALPGAPVYFAYTVSNTGNGTDTIGLTTAQGTSDSFDFTGVAVYADGDCNGRIDSGENVITSVTQPQGDSVCVVVAATIPASAANNQNGNLNLVGTSQAGTPGNTADDVTDSNNWARGTATTAAAFDLNKSASPTDTVSPGATITYTLSGQNRGGSAATGVAVSGLAGAGILLSDAIPNGLTVSAAPTGSAGAGAVQIVYSTNGGTSWSATSPLPLTGDAAGNSRVGMYISGTGAFFPQTAAYTFSFSAVVPAGATQGSAYANTATLLFNNGAANQTVTSNTTTNTVGAAYSVAVGPQGAPSAGASGTYSLLGNTVTRSGDAQTIASVVNGRTVAFENTLRNTGNTADSFSLSLGTTPAGWVCQFYQTDGTTPISGAVGPFAAGADFSFRVNCLIPAGFTSATASSYTVTATSVSDAGRSDTTTNTVSAVTSGFGVDLAQLGNGGDGNGANDNPAGQSANPGSTVSFPIEVVNTGSNQDSYTLAASTLPSGWAALYYPDANCDGSMDTPAPAPTTTTGLMNTGTANRRCFIAAVQVATGAAPGANAVAFTATSTTLGSVTDTVGSSVTVNLVRAFVFDPDRSGSVTTPGTLVYTHTLRNNGNAAASVSIPAFASGYAGWVYQFSTDGGTTWGSAVSIPSGSFGPGTSVSLQVRVIVPAGEPIGRVEAAAFTATADYGSGNTATGSVVDTTTVIGGDLRLTKTGRSFVGTSATVRSATAATALPGDDIEYTITAENIGTASLSAVRISDPLPAYTNFVSLSAATTIAGGTVVYSTDGVTWSTTAPVSLSAGQAVYVAVNTAGPTATIDSGDLMPAGSSITITFRVRVR